MITEWTLPSKSDNNSGFSDIAFDSTSGSVYFIEINGNVIGRLEPSTNTFTEWALSPRSTKVSSLSSGFGGIIYFLYSGTNKIGGLDPATNTITEWTLPGNSSKLAGIAFDPTTGNINFADSGGNKIGRLVPTTNAITEWNIGKSPLTLSVTPGGSTYYTDDIGGIGRLG
jgi:virginiamycin B lyase